MPILHFTKNKSWPILFYVCHMGPGSLWHSFKVRITEILEHAC